MSQSNIFDTEIEKRGLRPLDLGDDLLAEKGYEHLRDILSALVIDACKLVPDLPEIIFGFSRSEHPNAHAFRSNGKYFVVVTSGTVFLLELVIMRMLSDARLFAEIGNVNEEASGLPPLSNFEPNARNMTSLGYRAKRPQTKARHIYAIRLLEEALLFLVGHEIAHITLGHVDYLEHKGLSAVTELGWHGSMADAVIE
jgi:hypothetical protein